MRILVTGAAGFIGSAVLDRLANVHEATGLDVRRGKIGTNWILGDLASAETIAQAEQLRPQALIHLATVPGGAAEADPALAWRINVESTQGLIAKLSRGTDRLRVVFASSIAALGRLNKAVDDTTPLRPHLLYGAHKLLVENWLAALSRRGDLDAISLRLPGIVARPPGLSGMKSAYMSDLFHAALAKRPFVVPVSPDATMWLMSVSKSADNLVRALDASCMEPFAFTLPALRVTFAELVGEIAKQTEYGTDCLTYQPDLAIEADFGRYPALIAAGAERLGFQCDRDLASLVASAINSVRDFK